LSYGRLDSSRAMTVQSPDTSAELSVILSPVLSGSTRVTLTVARPWLNTTVLPVAQTPGAG
jgi:hypothetical protein